MAGAAPPSACDALRADSAAIWGKLHLHPLVQELAAGTLPLEKFRLYIEQDLLFLPDFARAIGMAIGRARDHDELRQLVGHAHIIVEREIGNQQQLLNAVTELIPTTPVAVRALPATSTYGNWMLATAARGDALDVMVAQLPCAWSYADIAVLLADRVEDHPVYREWFEFFGGAFYVSSIAERRRVLDGLLAPLDATRRRRHSELFATATRLELAFWDMAYSEDHNQQPTGEIV